MAIREITLNLLKSRCRINPRTECWDWANYVTKNGYGRINSGGKSRAVHRVAYELAIGPIPAGKEIYHDCTSTSCCNPDHLLCGTRLNILRAAKEKGRTSCGIRHSLAVTPLRRARAKLSMDKAHEIRGLNKAGASQRNLAQQFGVSRFSIQCVVSGRTWRPPANFCSL